jgi:hypothetical protein
MKPRSLTSGKIHAARAFLRWSADDLAGASAVGVATIRRAEPAEAETSMNAPNDIAVRRALEAAGRQHHLTDLGQNLIVRPVALAYKMQQHVAPPPVQAP